MEMSDSKRTPGPWKATCLDRDGNRLFWDIEQAPAPGQQYRGAVARVHAYGHIDGITLEERDANAHLISAAPDLLRVAELLVDWLDEDEGAHKLCDTARAAIAKAEGRS